MLKDDLVQKFVNAIVKAFDPVQVVLFGSRAKGEAQDDSDIDLLVVYDGPIPKRELKLAIRRLFSRPEVGLDLFVLTPDEYERQKRVVSTVGREASREGVVCYG